MSISLILVNGRAQRGGCQFSRISGLGIPQPHSSISLIPLWLSHVNRPARFGRGRKVETRLDSHWKSLQTLSWRILSFLSGKSVKH